MGIYNKIQMKQLQNQLENQMAAHNKLVEVVQQQDGALQQLSAALGF